MGTSYTRIGWLFLIVICLVGASILIFTYAADLSKTAQHVAVTNLTSNSATITWTSNTLYHGKVSVTPDASGKIYTDDRDTTPVSRYTHHVTINNLQPGSKYDFQILGELTTIPTNIKSFVTPALSDPKLPSIGYGLVTDLVDNNDSYIIIGSHGDTGELPNLISTVISGTYNLDLSSIVAGDRYALIASAKSYAQYNYSDQGTKPFETINAAEIYSAEKTILTSGNYNCDQELQNVSGSNVNIRKSPGVTADITGKVQPQENICAQKLVIGDNYANSGWYEIGVEKYVAATFFKLTTPIQPKSLSCSPNTTYTTLPGAGKNLRAQANIEAKIILSIPANTQVTGCKEFNAGYNGQDYSWVEVAYGSSIGFVAKHLITVKPTDTLNNIGQNVKTPVSLPQEDLVTAKTLSPLATIKATPLVGIPTNFDNWNEPSPTQMEGFYTVYGVSSIGKQAFLNTTRQYSKSDCSSYSGNRQLLCNMRRSYEEADLESEFQKGSVDNYTQFSKRFYDVVIKANGLVGIAATKSPKDLGTVLEISLCGQKCVGDYLSIGYVAVIDYAADFDWDSPTVPTKLKEKKLCTSTVIGCKRWALDLSKEAALLIGSDRSGYFRWTAVEASLVSKLIKPTEATDTKITQSGQYKFVVGHNSTNRDIIVTETGVEIKVFMDLNDNGIKDAEDYYISDSKKVVITKQAEAIGYQLDSGWNLIHIPLISTEFSTASRILTNWNKAGANLLHLAVYRNNQFRMFTAREDGSSFGQDSIILPGEAFFVFNTAAPLEVTLNGQKPSDTIEPSIQSGWNLVGFNESKAASTLLGGDKFKSIASFTNSNYSTLVYDKQVYGNELQLVPNRGYFVLK